MMEPVTWGDGDGFIRCAQGHTHWGRFGAAGLLAHHDGHVLLQHRAKMTIGGGTWGVFGGARNRDEDAGRGGAAGGGRGVHSGRQRG